MLELGLQQLNHQFETATPQEILTWAWETFKPGIVSTSSFQTQSLPLLHIISQVTPQLIVFYLDTGFHFPETLAFRDRLVNELNLNVQVIKSEMGHDQFKHQYGDLFRENPDLCCYINKVEPLQRALKGQKAWISGIRRDQTTERSNTPIVAMQADGIYKISPLAQWTSRDIGQYIYDHNLPDHPLLVQGYLSIGCAPCTQPVTEGQDERTGRWVGQGKTECGLHVPLDLESFIK